MLMVIYHNLPIFHGGPILNAIGGLDLNGDLEYDLPILT